MAHCQDAVSTKYKICALTSKLNKHDAFHEGWIWLDTEKVVDSISYTYVGNEHVACGIQHS